MKLSKKEKSLWYYSYDEETNTEIDIYPWDCIIMVDVCFGYYRYSSTGPTMAKAFVDYHANAFCGATIKIPAASDTYMCAFWEELCQNALSVSEALTDLGATYGHNWNVGDEWRIYGDTSSILLN